MQKLLLVCLIGIKFGSCARIMVESPAPAPLPTPPAPAPPSSPADAHEIAAWLNRLYSGFDENDDSSQLGVTMSMSTDGSLYCGSKCYHGHADCRLSASVYNSKVMTRRATGQIKVAMNRPAGFVVNQTRVEHSLAKCSYMFDGATFNRYNNACGCASRKSDCNDETSAYGNVCPSTGKTCTPSHEEVSRCSCANMPIPDRSDHPQCFFEGPAFGDSSEDQTRTMLKERISRQDGSDTHDRLEYWNEIVLDLNVMNEQLMVDPRAVVPAFTYVKSHGSGRTIARKLRDNFVEKYAVQGEIPLIAIDDRAAVTDGEDPFSVEVFSCRRRRC